MKKILTFLLTALLAFGVGWAETVTLDFTNNVWNLPTVNTVEENSYSNGTYTITLKGTSGAGYRFISNGNYLILGKSGAYLTLPIFDKDVTKIVVEGRSGASGKVTQNIFVGETAVSTETTGATGTNTYEIASNYQAAGNVYTLKVTNANNTQITKITITLNDSSTPPSGPKYYHKVTSNDELAEGNKYIIVYESGNQFLGAVTTSTSGYGAAVSGPTISDRQVDIDGYSDIAEWTLGNLAGTTTRNFTLNNGNGYLYAISGSNEYLTIKSDNSGNYPKWNAVFDANGGCTLRNGGASMRYIQYNSSGPNFTCSNTHVNAYLYVEGEAPALPTAEAPTFNPDGGDFIGSVNVTITSDTEGATIYYTTDGSTPTTSSSSVANGGTVTIDSSCTLKAIAVAQGYENSTVAEATYTKATVSVPTFLPNGGTYDIGTTVEVSISAMTGASIYYTLDGTDPVASRTAYTGPITISETTTLKAIAVYNGESSEVATAQFNFTAPGSTCDATISFRSKGDDSSNITDLLSSYVEAGSGYLTSISGTNVYSTTDKGIRLGTGSNTGSVTLRLATQSDGWRVTSVVLNAAQYGSDTGSIKVTTDLDGTGTTIQPSGNDLQDYTFTLNSNGNDVSWIKIETTSKRAYIKSVTINYECTPQATLTAEPNPLNINDTNDASGRTGTIYVSGENLGNDNVGVTNYDPNHSTNFSSNPGYFGQNGTVTNYPVAITYDGRALSATGIVYPANNLASTSVNINYLYMGPIYVVGDVNNTYWNANNAPQMTRDENGLYTVNVTVQQSDGTAGYITFSKKSGSDYGNHRFGPYSNDNWWLDGNEGVYQPIDTVNYTVNNIRLLPGSYTMYVDSKTNQFMIEPYALNITISPEDGTHFTGPSISGTITSNHADATIEWSTDGTNWQSYTDGFTATVATPGQSVTIYARATGNSVTTTAQATYTRDYAPAPDAPIFSRGSGEVARGTVITITAPEGCTLYVDGQQVNSPYEVTINHSTSISAYCVNDEGTSSIVVTNTYTVATVCEASIVFSGAGTSGDGNTNLTEGLTSACFNTNVDQNATDGGIIASSSTSGSNGRLYNGKGKFGLKFGSTDYTGSLTINLNSQPDGWQVTKIIVNALPWSSTEGELHVTTSANTEGVTRSLTYSGGTINDFADYEFNFDGSEITSFTVSTTTDDKRCYVKSITLVYRCGVEVEAPVITPDTGTYYESQTVGITAGEGCTIYYTTNGTTPTASSPVYTGEFPVSYTAGATTTIKAMAVDQDDNESEVTTVTYTWGTPAVTIHPDSRNTLATSINVTLTSEPADGTIYYTTDGSTPSAENGTQYSDGFTVSIPNVGDAVTVKAVTVVNGMTSPVATATYTHVAEVLDVHAPFFSPLQNRTYYGDQTLQIGCTTPNADIYYEIVEVSGNTAPSASAVEDPTHMSTHYDGTPIEMTAGHSYYVKAIAYIGNYVSNITEGYYIIEEFTQTGNYFQNLKDFNDNATSGIVAHLVNPVQVVYHSTYTNDGTMAEFCYVRDNTDYALIYFGKADESGKKIFEMGDWLDGSQIVGVTSSSPYGYHIQLGNSGHEITSWPNATIGHNEILPEETTCQVVHDGTQEGENSWGHYIHLRYTTLNNVADDSANDMKHNGYIADHSGTELNYYDKFYRWSAGTSTYQGHTYTIHEIRDYDQVFFDSKQNAGATFDVYGVVDYYSSKGFQLCPIDFLWVYKPVISLQSGTYNSEQTVSISVTTPEWAAESEVIYYKTDDMEDWAVYDGPITVNSDTHLQVYAELPAHENGTYGGVNYNDYIRSEIVEATYNFEGVEDPIITPASQVIELVDGTESVNVTVQTNPNSGTGTVTLYTTDGSDPRTSSTAIVLTGENGTFTVTETTTVNAVSYLTDGENTIWSNVVTETYEFIEDNGKTYDLLTTNPKVGSIYVIVNKADKVGLSKTQNATNRAATGVVFTDDATKTVVKGNTTLEEFVLEAATAGRYYFRALNTSDYLVVTTNDNPNLMTGAADANAEAAVTVNSSVTSGVDESYPATVAFSYEGTTRYLRYYAGGRTFTTYTAATTNQDIFLYGIEVPELLDPTIDPHTQVVQVTTGGESVTVTVTPNSENPAGAVTYYTTDGSDPRTSSTRIEWNSENGEFTITNTTTVKAVTGMEFGDGMVWSNVVSETYTFVGIEPPMISPESQTAQIGTSITVTVTPSDQNPAEAVTYYTTDDSDPRTSSTCIEWNSSNGEFDVTETTIVKAATCLEVDGETVWSVTVSETYTFEAALDSLHNIEATGVKDMTYTVADELIGAWAISIPNGAKLLWAKDQGNISIDKRPGKIEGKQRDYVKEILKYEKKQTWDESNWVILDFANIDSNDGDPEDYVGHKIEAATVEGTYSDTRNYTITLTKAPSLVNETPQEMDAPGYPGWQEPFNPNWLGEAYAGYGFAYNTFVPANFMTENHNRLENGEVVGGFVADNTALPGLAGDSLYFVNPKIQEVARVWAVWCGNDETTGERKDLFSVYMAEHKENENINAWNLNGTFHVKWDYNCKSKDSGVDGYGAPTGLVEGVAYEFHAVVMRPKTRLTANGDVEPQGTLNPGTPTPDYEIYPLDVKDGGTPTAVVEVFGTKTVVGVSYYNLMGQQSNKPFEGINIVVTRYSDGSTSSVKVLR